MSCGINMSEEELTRKTLDVALKFLFELLWEEYI